MRFFLVFLCASVVSFSSSASPQQKSCVDGLWLFDDDASETLFSMIEDVKEASKEDKSLSLGQFPNFVFTASDLQLRRLEKSVLLEQEDINGEAFQRQFSTAGETQSVSLKTAYQSGNTVIASWEDDTLIIETTGVTGLYVEEVFSLIKTETEAPVLHIVASVRDRNGLNFSYEKFFRQSKDDWLACQRLRKNSP